MSLTKGQFDSEHEGLLQEKYDSTIENIKQLQDIEKYMYKNLEIAQGKGETASNMDLIKQKISELVTIRKNLYNQLSEKYKESSDDLNNSRNDLADQYTMVSLINDELDRIKSNYETVEDVLNSKRRMVEISDYEEARYKAYNHLMYLIVIAILAMLVVFILQRNGFLSGNVSLGLISIIIAVSLIYIARQAFYMATRSSFNYDEYATRTSVAPSSGSIAPSKVAPATPSSTPSVMSDINKGLSGLEKDFASAKVDINITKK